jgi:polyhydroxybutyrate depolymerase
MARSYLVARPRLVGTAKLPILVVLHGQLATPEGEMARDGYLDVVWPAIVVYPVGYDTSWNAGACCGAAQELNIDDVSFVTAVVQQVERNQADASTRAFLVGFSNGGRLVFNMACYQPQLFAGFAVVSAAAVMTCPHRAPVPFLYLAGDADTELTITPSQPPVVINGFAQPSVDEIIGDYESANGCPPTPVQTTSGTATSELWKGCATGDPVELVLYHGQEHSWFQADGQTPSAQAVTWKFFTSLTGA